MLSNEDIATIAAATATAATLAANDEEHDDEKGSEEPFFDAFLTGAVRGQILTVCRVSLRAWIIGVPHYDGTKPL